MMKKGSTKKVSLKPDQKEILRQTLNFVKMVFQKFEQPETLDHGGHGFDHVQRVTGMALHLSLQGKKDPFLPILAALLHDVGRTKKEDPRSKNYLHGLLSRELVIGLIDQFKLANSDKELVLNAIEDHTFLNEKVRRSYVAEILMDADRLDGLGALGPIRAAVYKWNLPIYKSAYQQSTSDGQIDTVYGYFGGRIMEWEEMMWTKAGKKIAKKRTDFLRKFNQEFLSEIKFMQGNFDKLGI